MQDFDTERRERNAAKAAELGDRKFKLCDVEFTYRPVVSYTVLEKVAGFGPLEGVELLGAMEQAALAFLEDGQEENFLRVVRNTEDPLTVEDLNNLVSWLTEAAVSRPTPAPSLSTPGAPATATSSREGSSTRPVAASAA